MPLVKAKLITDLQNALESGDQLVDSNTANKKVAEALADVIDNYIKSATVTVTTTVMGVTTVGTALAQSQAAPLIIRGTGDNNLGTGGIS